MDLTPAIAEYVKKRVGTLGKFVSPEDTSAYATVEIGKSSTHHAQGDYFFAEINVHISGGDFRVVKEKDDLYAAIDEAKDEIIREVTRHKGKRRTLVRRGGAAIKNLIRGVGGSIMDLPNKFRRTKRD